MDQMEQWAAIFQVCEPIGFFCDPLETLTLLKIGRLVDWLIGWLVDWSLKLSVTRQVDLSKKPVKIVRKSIENPLELFEATQHSIENPKKLLENHQKLEKSSKKNNLITQKKNCSGKIGRKKTRPKTAVEIYRKVPKFNS